MATDIEVTRERLHESDTSHRSSLGALSSLSEAYAAVWQDDSVFEKPDHQFFLFEDRSSEWVDAFVTLLRRGRPLLSSAPEEVLDLLRASRPQQVQSKAWLVMYYSIILSMVSSTNPGNQLTKTKLRCNLWLALNDVRLLLEPSEPNIQALTLLASHVEEFTTPSLSWMLVTNACRMLQALGVNHRRLDPQTRERRIMMFWYLNIMDKGLALIFGRPPTFHRAMTREIALPSLKQLLAFQPHSTSTRTPSLFGAHYLQQIMLQSRVIGDIWDCLYEETVPSDGSIEAASKGLESWYFDAQVVLEAAAVAEKPFLDARGSASIDLGLINRHYQYLYLSVLLTRVSGRMKAQCLDSSKIMLGLLERMVSDSEEPYNGIVWQLVCSPFTPFLMLFGDVVSNGDGGSWNNQEALTAMEHLPGFLAKMSVGNSLAAKLQRIATVFVQHARSVVHPQETVGEARCAPEISTLFPGQGWSTGNTLDWESFFNHAMDPSQTGDADFESNDLTTWTNDFFGDGIMDWIGRDGRVS